jgi:colanic acid biosynthesis glycosyl transferase WcaI
MILMKTRILFVTQHFPPENSGNASRIYDLSRNLVELGCEVTVLSPYPTFPHGNYKKTWKRYSFREIDGIKHFNIFTWQPTKKEPSFSNRIAYYLTFPIHALWWAFLKKDEYDVIITSAPPTFTGLTGFVIKKITKKNWYFDVRDLWINASLELGFLKKESFFEKISRYYEKICYRVCDTITVTTDEIKKVIENTYHISADKIIILPNGVDTKLFKPSLVKKNCIIYAGNIGHAQDLEKVILAVKKVNENFPLEFCLVGDGDITSDLIKLVKKEKLENTVNFTGPISRENIPKLIAESLLGIAPLKNLDSLKYAIPTKAYEYMACGIPFLGTGTGEIERLVKHSGCGLVAKNTVESIYEYLIQLLNNKELIKTMGNQGREFVEKYYDRRKIAEHLLANIENVILNDSHQRRSG